MKNSLFENIAKFGFPFVIIGGIDFKQTKIQSSRFSTFKSPLDQTEESGLQRRLTIEYLLLE